MMNFARVNRMDVIQGLNRVLKRLAAAAALCLIALLSLQAAPPREASIYPLAEGSKWIYQAGPIELVEEVVGFDEINGERCARLETRIHGKQAAYEHLAVRADGVYRVSISGYNVEPPICFLKHPTPNATSWNVDSRVNGVPITGKFERGQEQVRVPAGEFSAVTVRGTGFESDTGSLEFTYYFVPGVGKVKQVISSNGKSTELLLKEYHPAR
jgi:hypothetical protein